MKKRIDLNAGFTLIELAIVLGIVGLVIGGLLIPLSMQIEQQKIRETQKAMEEIKDALIGFAIVNGRLPCPAAPALATGSAGAGEELSVCPLPANMGVIPWVTLGVTEADAWGRRFTYRVTPEFADAAPDACALSATSFAICSAGNNEVLTKYSGGGNVATKLPTVIVSHGKNGLGGYQQLTGTQIANTSAGGDEKENSSINETFVSRIPTVAQTSCDDSSASPPCEFDDLVTWISPGILISRMVSAGRLP